MVQAWTPPAFASILTQEKPHSDIGVRIPPAWQREVSKRLLGLEEMKTEFDYGRTIAGISFDGPSTSDSALGGRDGSYRCHNQV